ncbi:hypothetical protein DKAM_0835 [Desulfurococcus amylolyticus 1221n]|uniref:Uncharacterized protein n=1 Tax=Desulfurococcus amylolyticus (strain DSM 18924 / JCM 16383 / VKM B-2413 / 1221n) TaxID=490899 RepID=B8D4Y0_DESA1|nr:hypothetical protein [Desulfurococcus amylolyticus]ACL11161.1 hypothetical protein DKAM_0835 [Desulfurococcus amylolyticus 1221n]
MDHGIKIYRNEDVEEIVACIPEGHRHVRLILKLSDQIIILQEATVAAIVRAYLNIALHPTRKYIRLVKRCLSDLKQGFAKTQLMEESEDNKCLNIPLDK